MIVSFQTAHGQNWKKILGNINNPEKAVKYSGTIEKSLITEPNNIMAHYCLSILNRKEGDPRSMYLAWVMISRACDDYKAAVTVPDKSTITKLLINPQQKLDDEYHLVDSLMWIKSEHSIVLKTLNRQLPFLENSRYFAKYIALRNQFEYQEAFSKNTIESYDRFLALFPNAVNAPDAVIKRDKLVFELVKEKDFIYAYNEFIARHPQSVVFEEALIKRDEKAFELVVNTIDIDDLDFFIANYPTGQQVDSALHLREKLAFKRAVNLNTIEAYQDFIIHNQLTQYIPDAIARRDALVFAELQKFTDCSSYQIFISGLPFAEKAFKAFLSVYQESNSDSAKQQYNSDEYK